MMSLLCFEAKVSIVQPKYMTYCMTYCAFSLIVFSVWTQLGGVAVFS